MVATLFSLFLNLTSCTPADTIAPDEEHSSAREDASIVSTESFENKKIASFWLPELYTPTAGQIVTDQTRSGKQAMEFSWKSNQVDGTNKMLHSELATRPIQPGETAERWYGYSSYMPSASMANDSKTVIVSQWHGVPNEGGAHTVAPIAISVETNNHLKLIYFASAIPIATFNQWPAFHKDIDLGPASFDRWVDYVVHVKWDATGKTGLLEVWQDGKQVVNEKNISIGYPEMQQPYWKMGLYCWTGQSKYAEKNIYYDEVRIGSQLSNYDSVKPGRSDNSARKQQ